METNQINLHWIEISRSALRHNLSVIKKQLLPKTKIMAMVKANAYGHGLPIISIELAPLIDFFGVNTIEEALTIRRLGIKNPIFIAAPISPIDFPYAHKYHLSPCVHSIEYLNTITKSQLRLRLHLKINTGMNRLGLSLIELLTAINTIRHSRCLPEGIYTHFHSADTNPESVENQLDIFNQAVYQAKYNFPQILAHCANSAATFTNIPSHFDMVRTGHAIYGLYPHPNLKSVLTWKAKVIQSRNLQPGSTVGYNETFTNQSPISMSVLPIGYSDGLDRKLGNLGYVYSSNHLFPIIGRISMNFTTIASDKYQLDTSDTTEIIGSHVTAQTIAKLTDTVDYEVVSRLNPGIPRIIVK